MFFTEEKKREIRLALVNEMVEYYDDKSASLKNSIIQQLTTVIDDKLDIVEKANQHSILTMEQKITDLVTYYNTKITNLEQQITEILKDKLELQQLANKQHEQIDSFQEAEKERLRKREEEPFAEVISNKKDESGRLETVIDWNQPFILDLISRGFRGRTDEEIIAHWLSNVLHSFTDTVPIKGEH